MGEAKNEGGSNVVMLNDVRQNKRSIVENLVITRSGEDGGEEQLCILKLAPGDTTGRDDSKPRTVYVFDQCGDIKMQLQVFYPGEGKRLRAAKVTDFADDARGDIERAVTYDALVIEELRT